MNIQILLSVENGTVQKFLSYPAEEPFLIVNVLGQDSEELRNYYDKDAVLRKYKSSDLYH